MKTTAVIASIEVNSGVVLWKDYEKSVNVVKFISYLNHLVKAMKYKPFYLFLDNLSVHHNKLVKAEMSKLGIKPIYNAAYESTL